MRISQLDGLRGVAACSVLAFHLTTRFDELYRHSPAIPISASWGFLGVHLFFAISGFVILMTLRNVQSPLDFVIARFARIYPTFWAAMILSALVQLSLPLPDHPLTLPQIAGNLMMLDDVFHLAPVDGAYWTLERELIFYMLMLGLWLVGLLKRPMIPLTAWLSLSIASNLTYIPWVVEHLLLLKWIPWFGLGVCAYVIAGKQEDHRWAAVPLAMCFVSIALNVEGRWATIGMEGLGRATWAAATFSVVLFGARGSLKLLQTKALLWLGAISYPLYLIHENVSFTLMRHMEQSGASPYFSLVLSLYISITLAWLLHKTVEGPAMQWIKQGYQRGGDFSRLRWSAGVAMTMAGLAIATQLVR